MQLKTLSTLLIAAATVNIAAAAPLPPETPIIVDGPVTVDAADIEGYLLRVPENRRAEVRASRDRVASVADNLFVARSLAAKARALGLDKEATVQRRLEQVQDALLADLYMQHLEKSAPAVNLEPRARELYIAEPDRFRSGEQVYVQHLLVGLNGRTREMAQERAQKIHAEIKAGKEDFLALAARLSDDPDKKRNGGDLGYNNPAAFVAPVAKRIAGMKTKGEISEPIESHQGFHIVRFMDRKAPEVAKFEDVKTSLIAEEKAKLAKRRTEEAITEVRSSPTVTVHVDKLDALVAPAGEEAAKAFAAEAAKASDAAKKP
jgi:peptidyl-prolyl cis-trans isomerase C